MRTINVGPLLEDCQDLGDLVGEQSVHRRTTRCPVDQVAAPAATWSTGHRVVRRCTDCSPTRSPRSWQSSSSGPTLIVRIVNSPTAAPICTVSGYHRQQCGGCYGALHN